MDVFSGDLVMRYGYINYFKSWIGSDYRVLLELRRAESNVELLGVAISGNSENLFASSDRLYLSHAIDLEIPAINIHVPQRGDKKHLVELWLENARSTRFKEAQKHSNCRS
ncbi:MAG: hypothetical protein U5L96_17930 [Owenweeksia sp.]|nr:hypothetical protein [Owenweeksia sp.]